ncbi:MAG TPA: Hsp20/alpha crystallin family protein [Candidatus Didemnitutus sp.]|nr:Hsp20/alpha crystallin family protein [Candidatus Didemnitutus sp.]
MNRIIRYSQPLNGSLFPLFSARRGWSGYDAADRLFESAFADFGTFASEPRFPVDLYEDKENSYVRAALPGVAREDINVQLADGTLTLSAARKSGDETVKFSRSVALPEGVQADKIGATYENGVLTVTLPKQPEAQPRKIGITVN